MKTIKEYIESVPNDRIDRLNDILNNIRRWQPDSELTMKYRMPTCSPETANTCIAPAVENVCFVSTANSRLYPSTNAEIISSSLFFNP